MNRLLFSLLFTLLLPAAAVAQITSSPQTVNGPLVVQGNAYVNGGGLCVNPLGSTGGNVGGICTNAQNSQITSGGNLGFPIAGTLGLTLGTTGGATLGSPTGGMPSVGVLNAQGLEINGQSFSTIPGSSPITPTGASVASSLSNLLGRIAGATTLSSGSSYLPQNTSIYNNLTAGGAITSSNTLLLPAGPTWPFNLTECTDTATATGGSQSNPLIATCQSLYLPNVGVGTGDRAALDIGMRITGTTAQTEGDAYYNGGVATILASSNLGGTNTSTNAIGDVYGFSTQTALQSGATDYASVHGAGEWDLQVDSGASVANKIGAEIALVTGDAVQGTNVDTGLLFTDRGSTTWNYGIEFGLPSGQGGSFPVSGTLIGSYAGNGSPSINVAYGIDLHNINFQQAAISLPGFAVLGTGHIMSANMPAASVPTVSACGTGAGFQSGSNDDRGILQTGTGTVNSCIITFGSSFAGAPGGVPNCTLEATGNYYTWLTGMTATSITVNFNASEPSTAVIYHCWD